MFSFIRYWQIIFRSDASNSYSDQKCVNVPAALHPRQHLILWVFFISVVLMGVQSDLTVFLIALSWWRMRLSAQSCVSWPFGYPVLWCAYSSLLHILIVSHVCFVIWWEFFIYSGYCIIKIFSLSVLTLHSSILRLLKGGKSKTGRRLD